MQIVENTGRGLEKALHLANSEDARFCPSVRLGRQRPKCTGFGPNRGDMAFRNAKKMVLSGPENRPSHLDIQKDCS